MFGSSQNLLRGQKDRPGSYTTWNIAQITQLDHRSGETTAAVQALNLHCWPRAEDTIPRTFVSSASKTGCLCCHFQLFTSELKTCASTSGWLTKLQGTLARTCYIEGCGRGLHWGGVGATRPCTKGPVQRGKKLYDCAECGKSFSLSTDLCYLSSENSYWGETFHMWYMWQRLQL